KDLNGRPLQCDHHLSCSDRQALPGADVERHAGPAPGIDIESPSSESLYLRVRSHALLSAVAAELGPYHIAWIEWPHRIEQLQLFAAQGVAMASRRGIYGQQRNHLQQMVLNHVANGADFFIKTTTALHAKALRLSDLYVVHEIAIPDGLEEGVGKAEVQEILYGLLAQVVIDAKHRRFGEDLV